MSKVIGIQDLTQHKTAKSCWIVINNNVYDVTDFLPIHPGGSAIILNYAGRDATQAFEDVHTSKVLEEALTPDQCIGRISDDALLSIQKPITDSSGGKTVGAGKKRPPPLSRILSLDDMEARFRHFQYAFHFNQREQEVARMVMPKTTYAFWSSGADSEMTMRGNRDAYARYFFLPRVLRAVGNCDPSAVILGHRCSLPVFTSATSLGKLAHPKAETNVTRAAGKMGIIQMTSTHTTSTLQELASARSGDNQQLWFQLYKNVDNNVSAKLVQRAESLGFTAICLTVDAAEHGNRERDIRMQLSGNEEEWEEDDNSTFDDERDLSHKEDKTKKKEGDGTTSGVLLKGNDADMTWEKTIPWLRSVTKLPIILKGIQSVEDAVEAAKVGVEGIVVSNHGGRQLEYSMPSIDVLYRIRARRPEIFKKLEVYTDGGVRRGTDVLKAMCLGAKAVGLGRPILYGNGSYGEAGVMKVLRIMEKEIYTGMRLLGARTVKDLVPEMVERVAYMTKL